MCVPGQARPKPRRLNEKRPRARVSPGQSDARTLLTEIFKELLFHDSSESQAVAYRVRAYNAAGDSAYSNTAGVRTLKR